jgi:ATP-binding cassette, subfamily C, bacterial
MKSSPFSTSMRLVRFVKPFASRMLFSISAGVAGHICAVSVMITGALAVTSLVYPQQIPYSLSKLVYILIVFSVLRGIFHYVEQYAGHDVAFRLLAKIRSNLFGSLKKLAPAKMVDRSSGDIVTSLTSDIEIIEVFFAHTIAPVSIASVMFFVLTAFFSFLHPVFGIIMGVSYFSVAVLVPVLNYKKASESGRKYRESISFLNSYLIDSLQGIGELILFGKAEKRIKEMEEKTTELHISVKNLKIHEKKIGGYSEVIITLSSLAILVSGLFLFRAGEVAGSNLIIAFVGSLSTFGSFVAISSLSNVIVQTFAASERIFSLEKELPAVEDAKGACSYIPDQNPPKVNFENVEFKYSDIPVLNDFSLKIESGQKVAIVGKSGCGKTTILRLLLRFWDPDSGEILIDGDNLKDFSMNSLRDNVSAVSQDTYIFNIPIFENISLGKEDAAMEEVVEAAKNAEIHDFIMTLPEKYGTVPGELGNRLSGGERQRLGIARALLKNSKLVLLDEMTSNLDTLNEKAILGTIKRTMKEKTVITVSHRETVAKSADKIINMKGV